MNFVFLIGLNNILALFCVFFYCILKIKKNYSLGNITIYAQLKKTYLKILVYICQYENINLILILCIFLILHKNYSYNKKNYLYMWAVLFFKSKLTCARNKKILTSYQKYIFKMK